MQKVDYVLPMSYKYTNNQFYVRRCYPVYYDMIINLLDWKGLTEPSDYITVTGTPGIGKSVFYLYFFQRWMHHLQKIAALRIVLCTETVSQLYMTRSHVFRMRFISMMVLRRSSHHEIKWYASRAHQRVGSSPLLSIRVFSAVYICLCGPSRSFTKQTNHLI